MSKRVVRSMLLVLGLSFALPTSNAMAQEFEITPFFSWLFGGSVDVVDDDGRNVRISPDASAGGGVLFDWIFDQSSWGGGAWSFQFLVDTRKTTVNARPTGEPSMELGDMRQTFWHGGFAYTWNTDDAIRPFLLGTLGATHFSADECCGEDPSISPSQTNFSIGFGGGVKFFMSDNIAIRGEFRGFSTDTDFREVGWICGWYVCGPASFSQTLWQGEARVGLTFAF